MGWVSLAAGSSAGVLCRQIWWVVPSVEYGTVRPKDNLDTNRRLIMRWCVLKESENLVVVRGVPCLVTVGPGRAENNRARPGLDQFVRREQTIGHLHQGITKKTTTMVSVTCRLSLSLLRLPITSGRREEGMDQGSSATLREKKVDSNLRSGRRQSHVCHDAVMKKGGCGVDSLSGRPVPASAQ